MLRQILLLTFFPLLFGFNLSPMSHSIKLSEKEKQAQFYVENPTKEPMPVIITILERHQNEDGSEKTPPTSDLVAFPPQLIIPPKEKRSIRVTWKGATPDKERAFRLIAEQLPLEVKKEKTKGSGIKMLLKYVAALYVDPGKTKAELAITAVKNDKKNLRVTIENTGTHHAPMIEPELIFKKGKKTIVLKGDQLKGLAGENILAKTKRTFLLPKNPEISSDYSGSINVED